MATSHRSSPSVRRVQQCSLLRVCLANPAPLPHHVSQYPPCRSLRKLDAISPTFRLALPAMFFSCAMSCFACRAMWRSPCSEISATQPIVNVLSAGIQADETRVSTHNRLAL